MHTRSFTWLKTIFHKVKTGVGANLESSIKARVDTEKSKASKKRERHLYKKNESMIKTLVVNSYSMTCT